MDRQSFGSPRCHRAVTFIEEWECSAAATHHTCCLLERSADCLMSASLSASLTDLPAEIWRKAQRGCRGRRKRIRRETTRQGRFKERRRYKLCLPTNIKENNRLLARKMEELTALAWSQREYRKCSLMCFTESWMHPAL